MTHDMEIVLEHRRDGKMILEVKFGRDKDVTSYRQALEDDGNVDYDHKQNGSQ